MQKGPHSDMSCQHKQRAAECKAPIDHVKSSNSHLVHLHCFCKQHFVAKIESSKDLHTIIHINAYQHIYIYLSAESLNKRSIGRSLLHGFWSLSPASLLQHIRVSSTQRIPQNSSLHGPSSERRHDMPYIFSLKHWIVQNLADDAVLAIKKKKHCVFLYKKRVNPVQLLLDSHLETHCKWFHQHSSHKKHLTHLDSPWQCKARVKAQEACNSLLHPHVDLLSCHRRLTWSSCARRPLQINKRIRKIFISFIQSDHLTTAAFKKQNDAAWMYC